MAAILSRSQWASCQIHNIAGCACAVNVGNVFSRGGENVPGIPGACATRNFTYLLRRPCVKRIHHPPAFFKQYFRFWHRFLSLHFYINSSPPGLDNMAAILTDDNLKCIFLNEKDRIPIRISPKFVPRS